MNLKALALSTALALAIVTPAHAIYVVNSSGD